MNIREQADEVERILRDYPHLTIKEAINYVVEISKYINILEGESC